ncbi:hypothetical protein C6P42_004576 [Pichia californica]|nr:hypothetical protein C6P42_004576 [[Candida] californica]
MSISKKKLINHLERFIEISKILESSDLTNTGYGSCICSDGSVRCDSSVVHMKTGRNKYDQLIDIGICVCNSSRYPMKDAVDVMVKQKSKTLISGVIQPIIQLGRLERDDTLISPEMSQIGNHYVKLDNKKCGNQDGIQDTIGVLLFEKCIIDGIEDIQITIGSSSGGNMLRDWKRIGSAGVPGSGCWLEKNKDTGDIVCIMVSGQGEWIIKNDVARKVAQTVSEDISKDPNGCIGWLTVFSIEGSDIVILMFAIHMALLIFDSQINQFLQKLDAKFCSKFHLNLSFLNLNFSNNKNCINRKNKSLSNNIINDSSSEILNTDSENTENHHNNFNYFDDDDDDDLNGFHHTNAIISNISKSVKKSEGGLYQHRFIVLTIIFLFPVLVSSVSFYINDTYENFIYWSFFRIFTGPWYFSWIFRHVIVVTILVIYISIYIFVMFQFKYVSGSMKKKMSNTNGDNFYDDNDNDDDDDHDDDNDDDDDDDDDDDNEKNVMFNTFGDSIWYKIFQFLSMLVFPDIRISAKLHGHGLDTEEDMINIEKLKNESVMTESVNTNINGTSDNTLGINSTYANVPNAEISKQIQNLLYEEAIERFTIRRSQIMRQMRVIFIYPLSFIILWLMPFVNHYQVTRTGKESLWSAAPSAIFQSLNCFVDVLVFLIREKPWQLTTGIDEMAGITEYNNQGYYQLYGWRHYISWLPGYRGYSNDLYTDSMTEMGTYTSSSNESMINNDNRMNYNNNNNTFKASQRKNTYGRSSLGVIPSEDDEDGESELTNENENENEYDTDNNLSSALDSYDTGTGANTNNNSNNNNDEMDLKDFLNSPARHVPKGKPKRAYKSISTISKPKQAASNGVIVDGNKNSISLLGKSGNSINNNNNNNNNSNTGLRRESYVSWRTWSSGSNKSNQHGNTTIQKELESLSKNQTNNSGISDRVKFKENFNGVHWNLHMFENGHSKTYDNNYINNNYGKSNNRKRNSNLSNVSKCSVGGNMSSNSNVGFDDEMDLLDFLKMGPRG